ncbi:MAG: glucosaminidase domain-containing protein [Mediterranea sp.]|jgi:LysM repeat protein|nr:glucosaminidase domain-containing protein [Mediterranea sp.]
MKTTQRNHISTIFSLLLLLLPLQAANAQKGRNANYTAYINTYGSVAVEQMKKHKIPASITLAQGLLESGAGRSELTRRSNNHFGIKCGSTWKGKTTRHDDDARDECFRVYKHAGESYEDHSLFLLRGTRYAFLFKLSITDYKGWARGLKQAGYATDPSYADRLIGIIEDYELYKYDRKGGKSAPEKPVLQHQVYLFNHLTYIIARNGDTFESLSKETGLSRRKLIKYNDLHKDYTLTDGDIIYLRRKNKKAAKNYLQHTIKDGDSMHSISQMYGIRLKSLYKMNRKDPDYIPETGRSLRLR